MQMQQRAVNGIAAIEKRIIEEAERQDIHGVRLEWNEDLDFGHLMDPVPVVVIAPDGKQVEEHFSIQEMDDYAAHGGSESDAKVEHIVQALKAAAPAGPHADSRGM
jgi:hypothetical protein